MKIGGLQTLSLIDYPGILCCIVFTQGCNFRCPYCHNPELILPEKFSPEIDINSFFEFLEKRKRYLKGVSITGGEPTIHSDLPIFIEKIKTLGYLVKLDTNGTNPEMIKTLLTDNLVDYIAMDVKGPMEKYEKIVNAKVEIEKILKSIEIIKNSSIHYEFKTTVVKSQLLPQDFEKIGELIKGAKNYYIQKFVPSKCIDSSFLKEENYSDQQLEEIKKKMLNYVENCQIR